MSNVFRLDSARAFKRHRKPLTDRQRYQEALWQQRLRNDPTISEADRELALMIGPPGSCDYSSPDGAA